MAPDTTKNIAELIETLRTLRSDHGCSWDREQTPESLRIFILEEAYELVDAIDSGEKTEILSELGDLLLQVVFQAQIFTERGDFGISDVARGISQKLRRRHPHIFSPGQEQGQNDWETIKQQELRERGQETDFALRQPKTLPALMLAQKCHSHLSKTKCKPQKRETAITLSEPDHENIGKALFQIVGLAHEKGIDCELTLRQFALAAVGNEDLN